MKYFTFTNVVGVVAVAWFGFQAWNFYHLWHPVVCKIPGREKFCLKSLLHEQKKMQWNIEIYTTPHKTASQYSDVLIDSWKNVDLDKPLNKEYNCTLPTSTVKNGSLYMRVLLFPNKPSLKHDYSMQVSTAVTDYKIPVSYFQLLGDEKEIKENDKSNTSPETHWRPKVRFHVMNENFKFDAQKLPSEIYPLLKITNRREYIPILFVDELSHRRGDLLPLNKSSSTMKIDIEYSPVSVGKLMYLATLTHSMKSFKELGFSDDHLDEVKSIFTDTNFRFFMLLIFVSIVHLTLDILAFKNDISYWKKRKTMVGISFNAVINRCISTIIIFLYFLDQKTSLLILIPSGVSIFIEVWKVTKALKVSVKRSGWKLKVSFGKSSEVEKATENFDQQAIKYLSYVMYPLCLAGAIYSLFYVPHKSWYSWLIQSLVNGVYAFGFLFMCPQLFINYKLKSVAHLPWRVFIYKAFNTFIDDVFAFIIQMPTSHRIACFRDDVVFFCYLYQLWLYPVDKTRVNEFGFSTEDEKKKKN